MPSNPHPAANDSTGILLGGLGLGKAQPTGKKINGKDDSDRIIFPNSIGLIRPHSPNPHK